jgi:pimeloyl-ACP methyl ester carboxylesterase
MPRLVKRLLLATGALMLLAGLVLGFLAFRFFSRLERVEPQPAAAAAFHSPYWLYTPWSLAPSGPLRLLVVPNNTGISDDDRALHESKAWKRVYGLRAMAEELGTPLLVPAFPRPRSDWRVYTHALDRDTLTTEVPELARLDRQLLAMVGDARARLQRQTGRETDPRVLLFGFSANGMFANRFTVLHPESVLAVAAGSPGGWPIAPCKEWQGRSLRYPIGIADAAQLTGQAPDLERLRQVPVLVFQGGDDVNDSLAFTDGWDVEDRDVVHELFGQDMQARFRAAEAVYRDVLPQATFRLYPGVGHVRTAAMDRDVVAFFAAALGG